MQSVSLADIVTLEPSGSGIQLTTNDPRLMTDRANLAFKAAEAYFKGQGSRVKGQGIKIQLEKNIPIAAGLAGGSADAAAVLYGLNQLSINNYQLTIKELMELGAQIGSDVPFCLTGGQCLVKGRGEIISSREEVARSKKKDYYVLVVPAIEVATKWAYDAWDRSQMTNEGNDLEAVVIKKFPVIQEVKDRLIELGCSQAQMSGSGPSVFGSVKTEADGKRILSEISRDYCRSYIVHPIDTGVEVC